MPLVGRQAAEEEETGGAAVAVGQGLGDKAATSEPPGQK